ncbi:hypothetical protein [Halosolutus halophilus]|uniref:hypothetical protein n=1 Tax=Halosolutus halophilus TaxID=1552990 RepID=UPI002235048D|nr:hypothetical protein [Halosolutus halophilus]
MSKCAECGMRTSPSRRVCKSCALEDCWGTPSDHFDSGGDGVRCWVQDIAETWHASMYFEGSRHVAACGEILETPVADLKGDPRFFDQTHTCEDCKRALEDDEAETTIPDGGEFERANEIATDGGEIDVYQWVLDTVHEYPAQTDSRWGCRGNLVHQGRKLDGVTKDDVREAITRAVDNEDLISWHGLLARADIETLREIVRVETEEHEITRQILVGKCNKLIAAKKQEQADENIDQEVATDGGLEEVFRRETIVATDDGIAIGKSAAPSEVMPDE